MAAAVVLLIGGTLVLAVGAELAVRGGMRTAVVLGVSPFLIGAILFGVDVESLGAALVAAGRGETEIAAGEAFGTIVFLFSAAFGGALLVSRKPIESPSRRMVLLPAAALALGALAVTDSQVGRLEGAGLIVAYAIYLKQVVGEGRAIRLRARQAEREARRPSRVPAWLLAAAGLAVVYAGAAILVSGGVRLLERTGLSAGFVGAAVIGALAAFDEVLLEVLPVVRGVPEIATGNLFGTVAAFSTAVLGLAALVRPLVLDGGARSAFLAASVLYALVATVFLVRGRAGKLLGLSVLALYGAWLWFGAQA